MELLELKSIWDVVIQDTITRNSIDEFVVSQSTKKGSGAILGKIKRVMYLKFLLGGVTLAACISALIGLLATPEKFTFFQSAFTLLEQRIFLLNGVVFIMGMLAANYMAFREIKSFNHGTDIRTSLRRLIRIMRRTIRLNTYTGAIFNAFTFTWIFYVMALRNEPFSWRIEVLIVAIVSFVTCILFYFLSRYEQKLKFGNYLKTLKENLESLEKEKSIKV